MQLRGAEVRTNVGFSARRLAPTSALGTWYFRLAGISVPLVYLGSYFGYKRAAAEFPTKTNMIPRSIPAQVGMGYSEWSVNRVGGERAKSEWRAIGELATLEWCVW